MMAPAKPHMKLQKNTAKDDGEGRDRQRGAGQLRLR